MKTVGDTVRKTLLVSASALSSFAAFALCTVSLAGPQFWIFEPEIWLGNEAVKGEDPWQVALVLKGAEDEGVWCGGSIIDERTVVTAAHCLKTPRGSYDPEDFWIVEGTTDLSSGGRWLEVTDALIHRSYDLATVDNDIALLRIDGALESEPIAFVTPEDEANVAPNGAPARVTGWGRTEFAKFGVVRLRAAEVDIVARDSCNKADAYNGAVTQNMICAGRELDGSRNIDSCSGDSGGPLTVANGDGRVQVGIVSWGGQDSDDGVAPCGQPKLVGVYTRFAVYSRAVTDCLEKQLQPIALCGASFVVHPSADEI